MTAIRSPEGDALADLDAYIIERTNAVLNSCGFIPDWTAQERANVLGEYRRALRTFPKWAVIRAFDNWVRSNSHRRPTPGEIVILAGREIQPITTEIEARRQAERERQDAADRWERGIPTKDEADAICRSLGFTPRRLQAVSKRPMAATVDELYAQQQQGRARHWSEDLPPGHPTRQLFGTDVAEDHADRNREG